MSFVQRKSLVPNFEEERDIKVLQRRKKDIQYGKNTKEYREYRQYLARNDRTPDEPKTPNLRRKYSRRAWDGLIRVWRIKLHVWYNLQGKNNHLASTTVNKSETVE